MAKVHLKALDYLIVASHYVSKGKGKLALQMLEKAAEEEDFDDTLTTLDAANEEGFDDGEDLTDADDNSLDMEDDAEQELAVALASLERSRRRRPALAAEESDSDEDGEDADDVDETGEEDGQDEKDEQEELSTARGSRRDRNLTALNRISKK